MKKKWSVVFWHNDFPENCNENATYGKDGFVYKRVLENIPSQTILEWNFCGGFISPKRINLFEKLKEADVLIAFCPWNMDKTNHDMHWLEAEESVINILNTVKKDNDKLRVFFLLRPHFLIKEFQALGDIIDIDDDRLYNYFKQKELSV